MGAVWRTWPGRMGSVLVGLLVVCALVSIVWTPHDPEKVVPRDKWLPMSWDHLFGTDGGGKDIFSQVLVGSRTTLYVSVATVVITATVGLVLGVLSAVTPRLLGDSIAHLVDVVIAIPTLILALVFVATLQGSTWTVSLALGIGFGAVLARVARAEVARVLTQDYIVTAAASGSSTWRTVWRHIVPNIAPTVIVQLSLIAALAVLAEAALSFISATSFDTPSWGRLLYQLQGTLTVHPGAVVFPGMAIVLVTLGFNLLGDGLRDAIDPRLRGRAATASPVFTSVVDQVEDPAVVPVSGGVGE